MLQLIRTQVVLKVEWEGTTFNIATQPESSVKQTLQQIHTIIRKKCVLPPHARTTARTRHRTRDTR